MIPAVSVPIPEAAIDQFATASAVWANKLKYLVGLIFVLLLSGCSTTNPNDPLEPYNRAMFGFNDAVDRAVLKPAAQAYQAVMPEPGQTGVRNFFSNLTEPWTAVNRLLQGEPVKSLESVMRFMINTVFGLGGLLDIATPAGLPSKPTGLSDTLGVWGVGPGPYFVMPFRGPGTLRDVAGSFGPNTAEIATRHTYVDIARDPGASNGWISRNLETLTAGVFLTRDEGTTYWFNPLMTLYLLDTRARLLDATNALDGIALDRYSFVRDATLQRRGVQLQQRPPATGASGSVNQDFDYANPDDETPPGSEPAKPTNP